MAQTVTYQGDAWPQVRRLAQALIDRGLSSERPVAILSGNGVDHGLLALACMYAGVLYAPISPAYSLQAREYGALRHMFELLRPGLVFVAEADAYEHALRAVLTPDIELVASGPAGLAAVPFADLLKTTATSAVDEALPEGWTGYDRQDPLHLGIDGTSQRRSSTPSECSARIRR